VEHFWAALKNFFMPDEDRYTYAEGLSRGGVMLGLQTEETSAARMEDILENVGAVNMHEREASWRSEGWTGYGAGTATSTSAHDAKLIAATTPSKAEAG
jgi:hypothetical protein